MPPFNSPVWLLQNPEDSLGRPVDYCTLNPNCSAPLPQVHSLGSLTCWRCSFLLLWAKRLRNSLHSHGRNNRTHYTHKYYVDLARWAKGWLAWTCKYSEPDTSAKRLKIYWLGAYWDNPSKVEGHWWHRAPHRKEESAMLWASWIVGGAYSRARTTAPAKTLGERKSLGLWVEPKAGKGSEGGPGEQLATGKSQSGKGWTSQGVHTDKRNHTTGRPLGFWSKTISSAVENYTPFEKPSPSSCLALLEMGPQVGISP